MNHRINSLEEGNEEVDFDGLAAKEKISVADIIQEIQKMKADIIAKTVSQTDYTAIIERFADLEN